MATPTQTFPCPFCGRRMGVRAEMLGRHVRCPHCSQVVLAPTVPQSTPAAAPEPPSNDAAKPISLTAPTPLAAPTPIPPEGQPPPQPPEPQRPDQPQYTFDQRKETAESILSDENESDDEVFSSQTGNKVPVMPQTEAAPQTEPAPATSPASPAAPPPHKSSSQIPTLELRTPVDIIPAPISASTLLPPPPAPATPTNPFAFDTVPAPQPVAAQPEPLPIPPADVTPTLSTLDVPPDTEAEESATRPARTRKAPAPASPGRTKTLLAILAAYAVLMTALAVYGLFFKSSDRLDPGNPLSTIPDNFGEFDPATRKKVTQWKLDFDAPLPADQRASLGQTIEVGQLRIEPVSVEKRPLRIIKEGKASSDVQRRQSRFHALVLHLRIKNTSDTTPIFPLDPAFTRAVKVDDKPAMRLRIGKQTLYGGAISWPFADKLKREYEEAQATDYDPLKPGESREYVVFTNEDSTIASTVRKLAEPLVWRVQVRRGLIEFKGKDVPVTAIIGVEFQSSDIKNLD